MTIIHSEILLIFDKHTKELCNSSGAKQVQFGRKLFVTKQCISNWENGNIQPSIDMIIKICTTFSVSADYILGLSAECTLDVSGLSAEQILHIQNVVKDLREANEK